MPQRMLLLKWLTVVSEENDTYSTNEEERPISQIVQKRLIILRIIIGIT